MATVLKISRLIDHDSQPATNPHTPTPRARAVAGGVVVRHPQAHAADVWAAAGGGRDHRRRPLHRQGAGRGPQRLPPDCRAHEHQLRHLRRGRARARAPARAHAIVELMGTDFRVHGERARSRARTARTNLGVWGEIATARARIPTCARHALRRSRHSPPSPAHARAHTRAEAPPRFARRGMPAATIRTREATENLRLISGNE